MDEGDPMMIPCVGGPTGWRTATFPPAIEVELADGLYVLIDDGPHEQWIYEFLAVAGDA